MFVMPSVKSRPLANVGVDFGPGAVASGRLRHRERRRVGGSPEGFPRRRVERRHDLFFSLASEHEKTLADHQRGRIAEPDVDLPLLLQGFGPR